MAKAPQVIAVSSQAEMATAITSYTAQGYILMSQQATETVLKRPKRLNILPLLIGFFLCLLPGLIYLIVYAVQKEPIVIISVSSLAQGQVGAGLTDEFQLSADGAWWWDANQWISIAVRLPPNAQLSEDKAFWWDGRSWRSLNVPNPNPESG